jgi:hypothetical protein
MPAYESSKYETPVTTLSHINWTNFFRYQQEELFLGTDTRVFL